MERIKYGGNWVVLRCKCNETRVMSTTSKEEERKKKRKKKERKINKSVIQSSNIDIAFVCERCWVNEFQNHGRTILCSTSS